MNNNKKYLIWYHNEDNDGVFSAAIIYVYLIEQLGILAENITLQGMTYNTFKTQYPTYDSLLTLSNTYDGIIMTDISFNDISQMKNLYEIFENNLIWIDHHKPIIDESYNKKFDNIPGLRDTSRSAILNAYKYFYDTFDIKYNNKDVPELFRILSAWDSFSYKREKIKFDKCRNVNKGVTVYFGLDINAVIPMVKQILNTTGINTELTKFIREMNKLGKQLNEYDDILSKNQLAVYGDYDWYVDNNKAVMLMIQGPTNSQIFKSLIGSEYKIGIIFKYLPNNTWNVSLYNIDTKYDKQFNCGIYLKTHYKGGGHAGAGGAVLNEKQFSKLLKNKRL